MNVNGGLVEKLKIAKFQADFIIAHLIINNQCDVIFANDSDIHLLAGIFFVQIANFKVKTSKDNNKNKV